MKRRIVQIPHKMRAPLKGDRPPMTFKYAAWSMVSGTVGILAIHMVTSMVGFPLLIGSFGASAVLLFGASDSPLTQPRNLIGGHVLSAIVAVIIVALLGSNAFSIALAVGCAILIMNLTHTTHPPGGATALIGVQGGAGLSYVFIPVLAGALILLLVAVFTNNLVYHRRYPRHWF